MIARAFGLALLGGLMSAALPSAAVAKKYTLNELLDLARAQNPGLRAGDAATHAMQAQVLEAKRNWYPQGDLTAFVAPVPRVECEGPGLTIYPDQTTREQNCVTTNASPSHGAFAVSDQLRGSLYANGCEAGPAALGLRQDLGRRQRSRGRRDGHDRARGGRPRRGGAQRAKGLLGAQVGARAAIDAGGGARDTSTARRRRSTSSWPTAAATRPLPIACACAPCGPRSPCGRSRPSGWRRSRAAGCGRC